MVSILLPVIITIWTFLSCDIGGFQDLAEMIDPTTSMGENSYSYMRTRVDGGNNVTEGITCSEPDVSGNGDLAFVSVVDVIADEKVTISMARASYSLSGTNITLSPYLVYYNEYAAGTGNAKQRDDPSSFDEIVSAAFIADVSGGHTFEGSGTDTLTYDGNDYTSVPTLFDAIMEESDAEIRATQFMHMYEYTVITSQTKIEGFGGLGMLGYIGRTVSFKGIRVGTFELTSEGTFNNQTSFQFKGYSDYKGLTMEGLQRSNTDRDGNGTMSEEVAFTIQGSADTWTGSVNYNAIVLEGTLPKQGYYLIKFDGIDDVGTQVDPLETTNPGEFDYRDIIPNS
jgi:hypothetical protein